MDYILCVEEVWILEVDDVYNPNGWDCVEFGDGWLNPIFFAGNWRRLVCFDMVFTVIPCTH